MRTALISTVLLFFAGPVFAQSTPTEVNVNNPAGVTPSQQMRGQQPAPFGKPSPAAEVEVPRETPVVTLQGVCDQLHVVGKQPCKTVVTRAQIDTLSDDVAPGAPSAARRTFALGYARLLAASAAAERQHLDKDPAVAAELQDQMKLARIRVLANNFYRQLEERAANVPASEIQKYYADHKANFESGEVRRLLIPRAAVTKGSQPLALDASDVKNRVDELVKRAAAGEDFDQLQQEAYILFGIEATPPATKVIMVRRTNLRPEEAKIFDLKVGETSQMVNSPDGFVILKLESKQAVPIEIAEREIKPILQRERMAQELQNAAKDVTAEFNLDYLGVSTQPELFVPPAVTQAPVSKAAPPELRPRAPIRRRAPVNAEAPKVLPAPL
jgi:hypothetical protein